MMVTEVAKTTEPWGSATAPRSGRRLLTQPSPRSPRIDSMRGMYANSRPFVNILYVVAMSFSGSPCRSAPSNCWAHPICERLYR